MSWPFFALGTGALGALPFGLVNLPAPATVESLTAEDAIYLIEIEAYSGIATTAYFPPLVIGSAPVGSLPLGTKLSGQTTTLLASDRGWIGKPDDAQKPHALYYPYLDEVPEYETEIPVTPEAGVRSGRSFGTIRLANLDGSLDAWVSTYAVAGRQVRVLRAPYVPGEMPAYGAFSLLFAATIAGWVADEEWIEIEIGGARVRLDGPVQTVAYAGTGGAEGDAQWADVRMPQCYGYCFNVTPDLIDTTNLVFRVHDREIQAIEAVRDRGSPLTLDTDYADYASLIGASLASGEYATCLALGLFRLESLNDGSVITCDVEGDVDASGSWAETHAEIAWRLARRASFAETELAGATFADAWPAGTAGVFFPSVARAGGAPSVSEALDRLAQSVAGWWGEDRAGRIEIGRLVEPASVASILSVTLADFREGEIEPVPLPRQPRWRQKVGYAANWTLQDNLVGSTAAEIAERKAIYGQPYKEVSDSDNDVANRYPRAPEPDTLESLFKGQSDALALAQHVMALHGPDRRIYRLPIGPTVALLSKGKTLTVTYPRGGFATGKPVIATGINDARGMATVWG